MSKFKKVISLVLCIAMLAGTITTLGVVAPKASAAAGETNVKTYAEIDADYNKFIYVGIDVIEVANGELTDGYVNAGDWLEYRMTILTDMYMGAAKPYLVYERDFFDVRVISSTNAKEGDSYTNNDYETNTKCESGKLMNADHPYSSANVPVYHNLTSMPASKAATVMGYCEIDSTTYSNWDLVFSSIATKTSEYNYNYPMADDAWYINWYVRVKNGLADGETGSSFSPEAIWQHNINPATNKGDGRRLATISTADALGTSGSSVVLSNRYNVVQAVLLEDTYHTFTIGEAPAVEEPGDEPVIETKPVTFQTLDGTVIETAEYAEGETVTVPAVEGLVAWTENNKAVELGESFVMGQKALTYTAVLDTDKFNISIDLAGGTYAELPEGAEIVDGKLVIKAGFGETVDLSVLPLPEKEGYTGAWNPATVTIDTTRGVNANIKWTKATYTAKFFLDKEAFESGAAAAKEITFVYGNKIPFANQKVTKEDVKFAGWIDAATGEPANAETIYADNMNFYADWMEYNAAATIWGLDNATGEWFALATKKADAGTVIAINDLKALVTEANYGSAALTYAFATLTADRAGARVSNDGYVMVEGENNIYIQTNIKFTYAIATPVFGEDGFITEEVTSESSSIVATSSTTTINLPVAAEKTGYKFVAWADAEGNEYAAGNVTLEFANGTDYTFTAVYEAIEYSIEFVINKDATYKQTVKAAETFKLGDTFTLSEVAIVDAEGNESGLPEIGVNNEDQAYGPYDSLNGYKFKGWLAGAMASALVDYDITQEVTLTPAVLEAVTYSEVITIRGEWEARYFNLIAYYADSYDAEGNLVYKAMDPVAIKTGDIITDAVSAAQEIAAKNLPEGKRVTANWKLADGSARPNRMPAGDLEIYATYANKSLNLYIDYNNGTKDAPLTLAETMFESAQFSGYLYYNTDIENDIPEGELAPIAEMIRRAGVSETNTPGATYELVGWNIFYVVDEADVYDVSKWNKGVSDVAGSTVAKYTLIFQAEWMAHKDFLFRVYNTEGALRSAIDKKFQKHFWYNNNPVASKDEAVPLNALPDSLIVFGFMPKFEFTDGFAVRIDPIKISKAWLNPSNWGSLLEALFNGLSSGFGGAI